MRLLVFLFITALCSAHPKKFDNDGYHPHIESSPEDKIGEEHNGNFWNNKAQSILGEHLKVQINTNIAKNIILFLGDGMSVPTLAAARPYQGEIYGVRGTEGTRLSFQEFPYTGVSMTYCVNMKVADSACSATAYLGGVKGNLGTIGVDGNVNRGDCLAQTNSNNHVNSIAMWAQQAGKMTGVVTNARITHASPAGAYAHIADRDWENDEEIASSGSDPTICDDIAKQLIRSEPGKNFNVLFGGGRTNFIPKTQNDVDEGTGKRDDGLDLIQEWKNDKLQRNIESSYVYTKEMLYARDPNATHVLGLFNRGHMEYRLENKTHQPKVSEMTQEAIKILQKGDNGYFLFVEGARIDMAHHDNKARIALDETVELSEAVKVALEMTDPSDTLIIVTSDHAHTMSFSGYSQRSTSILEDYAGTGTDDKPYTVLSYANGPGFDEPRPVPTLEEMRDDFKFKYPAAVPLDSETHGGDDVLVFAHGPWAHIFTGTFEQNFIPHAMAFAACIGNGTTACQSRN